MFLFYKYLKKVYQEDFVFIGRIYFFIFKWFWPKQMLRSPRPLILPICRAPSTPTRSVDSRKALVGVSESGSHFQQSWSTKQFLDLSSACINRAKLQHQHLAHWTHRPSHTITHCTFIFRPEKHIGCPSYCVSRHKENQIEDPPKLHKIIVWWSENFQRTLKLEPRGTDR